MSPPQPNIPVDSTNRNEGQEDILMSEAEILSGFSGSFPSLSTSDGSRYSTSSTTASASYVTLLNLDPTISLPTVWNIQDKCTCLEVSSDKYTVEYTSKKYFFAFFDLWISISFK